MRRRHTIVATFAVIGSLAVAACGSSSHTGSSSASAGAPSSGTSHGTFANFDTVPNQYNACKNAAEKAAAAKAGWKVDNFYDNFSPATSHTNIQDALAKSEYKSAIATSISTGIDTATLKTLTAAHMPTVFQYGPAPPGTQPDAVVATDGYPGGVIGVNGLLAARPGITHVSIIRAAAGFPLTDNVYAGIVAALKKHGITPEETLVGDFTAQTGAKETQAILASHPDTQAIITLGDDMALAAARVANAKPNKPAVVDVFGFSPAAFSAVAHGQLTVLAYQNLHTFGTELAQAAIAAATGKKTHPAPVNMVLVNKANVGSFHPTC
jgi:ABC-type sugar transport system substrate-binding protein